MSKTFTHQHPWGAPLRILVILGSRVEHYRRELVRATELVLKLLRELVELRCPPMEFEEFLVLLKEVEVLRYELVGLS